ncbi:hypothetical protein JOE11_004612 [Robbsia andropogonis]
MLATRLDTDSGYFPYSRQLRSLTVTHTSIWTYGINPSFSESSALLRLLESSANCATKVGIGEVSLNEMTIKLRGLKSHTVAGLARFISPY